MKSDHTPDLPLGRLHDHLGVSTTIFVLSVAAFLAVMYYGPVFVNSEYAQIVGGAIALAGTLLWVLYTRHVAQYQDDMMSLSTRITTLETEYKTLVTKRDLDSALKPIHGMLMELLRNVGERK